MDQQEIVVTASDLNTRQHVKELLRLQDLDAVCCSTVGECHEMLARKNVYFDRNLADGSYSPPRCLGRLEAECELC